MITSYIDSLTSNSIGLFVLGLALLTSHFWQKWKLNRGTSVAVIDGMRDSFLTRLSRIKYLLAGMGFLYSGVGLAYYNYEQNIHNSYIKIIDETHALVMDKPILSAKGKKALENLESTIPLSYLNNKIASEIDNWYASRNDLLTINSGKPVCIKLYEIYERVGDEETLVKLDQIYQEFLKSFYGEVNYLKKVNNRQEMWERVKWSRMSPLEKAKYIRDRKQKEKEDRIRRGR